MGFESDPALKMTKANIYGRCLPCIQNLYAQLRQQRQEIDLGPAFHCWKVTAVVEKVDEALALLSEFEQRFPRGHVYGKLGNGRPGSTSTAVVFHTDQEEERDRLQDKLNCCLKSVHALGPVQISRGCAILYHDLLGDWQAWQPVATVRHPEFAAKLLARVKDILYRSAIS